MDLVSHANAAPHVLRNLSAPLAPSGAGHSAAYTLTSSARPAMSAAYAAQSPLVHSQAHTGSNYSIQSHPSSRSSDTTQGTAHSTLFPPPQMQQQAAQAAPIPNGNEVTANDNVMNSVADASSSLFQICVTLRQRLMGVPGCKQSLMEEEEEADEDTDPVTLLWRNFRRGVPLLLLYNALRPANLLTLPANIKEEKKGKQATFQFVQACKGQLQIPAEELFLMVDLYGDDTTGFVKVTKIVNKVLDLLVARGLIQDVRATASDFERAEKGMKRTQRQHIISELVTTERTYVQHLELLQAFKKMVEEKGVIPGDACHDIFLNLNALLDFQRRFLIRVEQINATSEAEQNWGHLFLMYAEAFQVYIPYIANQAKCEKTVVAEFAKLKLAGGTLEMRQMVESSASLYGFLMKPFQRISKYPLLLDDLYKKGDLDEHRKSDILSGKEIITSVLASANHAVDKEQKVEAVQDLKTRVEDWKGHKIEQFGDLLLNGTFTVLKSENLANGKDAERQYHVYLFEQILLCCKNIDPSKPKNKLSSKSQVDSRGKPKLQLKGRIFMQNVTDLVSLAKPGSYTCQIFWKGDPSIENFIIRFTTEEVLKRWTTTIEAQRRKHRETNTRHSDGNRSGTSATEFSYLQNQPVPENPYKAHDVEEEDDDDVETLAASMGGWSHYGSSTTAYSQSRNGSSSSLRSRSTTGESQQAPISAASARAPAPRFPPGTLTQQQPLALRTRDLQQNAQSPTGSNGPMESYFSPTGESPASSLRTSAGSGMYPFPTQNLPGGNGYYVDGHGHTRFTAPAMPRPQPSREPSMPSNGYAPPGRGPRPSFPNGAGMHSAQNMQPAIIAAQRNRSASSPDIQGHGLRREMRGQVPAVPDMPAPYTQHGGHHPAHVVNRSQNNSPNLPPGGGRGSPQIQRERLHSTSGSSNGRHEHSPTDYASRAETARLQQAHQYPSSRTITPVSASRTPQQAFSPPPPSSASTFSDNSGPSQLRVKVHCPSASQTLTLVVPVTITYQSLKDRIDAKLQRSTNLCLGDRPGGIGRENQVKLKYLDEDDYVSITSDEDVQTAFDSWREANGLGAGAGVDAAAGAVEGYGMGGLLGEIELFCQR